MRRQIRSLVVLALLIALSGATVLTAVAGARRGSSALDRLRAVTLPADAVVLPNEPGFDWDAVAALPEVEEVAPFVVSYGVTIDGVDDEATNFPFTTANFTTSIERPVVFEGRDLDVTRTDEVFVTPRFVATTGLGVGDRVHVDLPTPQENAIGTRDPSTTDRPGFDATIVGVGESMWLIDLPGRDSGAITLSPEVAVAYRDNVIGAQEPGDLNYINALVRLRGGEDGIPRFERALGELTGRGDIEIWNMAAQARDLQHHVDFESRWLLAFGLSAFLAALFLVGQAVARLAAADANELDITRSLGMTTRTAVIAGAIGPAIAGIGGALLGVAGAIFASRWMPIGAAGYFEPSPGITADWVVLGVGCFVIVTLVALGAAWSVRRALVSTRAGVRRGPSRIATAVGRSGAGVPFQVGVRFAVEPGRGRSRVPVAPGLVGAVVGVLGVVAAFSFSTGVDDAISTPERFGQLADASIFLGINGVTFAGDAVPQLLDAVSQLPEVSTAADTRTTVATIGTEGETLSLWELHQPPTGAGAVRVDGRLPETGDEIALGPKTLDALGASVGDTLTVVGAGGSREFTITGSAFVVQGPHNGYAEGGWVTTDGFDRVDDGFKYEVALIDLVPGADPTEAVAAIDTALVGLDPSLAGSVQVADPPEEIAQLAEVRSLPLALGVFLALLAVGAVGHSLATAVRRRAGDLAVLRALGMTSRQTQIIVAAQATVLALVGLLAGVPLGLLVGFRVWRSIATFTPFQYSPPWAAWVLVSIAPAALLVANLLAAWPARRAAGLTVARTLRAE